MRSEEVKVLLKKYEEQLDEPLSELYIHSMDDEEVEEVIKECLKENKTYYELMKSKHGNIIF